MYDFLFALSTSTLIAMLFFFDSKNKAESFSNRISIIAFEVMYVLVMFFALDPQASLLYVALAGVLVTSNSSFIQLNRDKSILDLAFSTFPAFMLAVCMFCVQKSGIQISQHVLNSSAQVAMFVFCLQFVSIDSDTQMEQANVITDPETNHSHEAR